MSFFTFGYKKNNYSKTSGPVLWNLELEGQIASSWALPLLVKNGQSNFMTNMLL